MEKIDENLRDIIFICDIYVVPYFWTRESRLTSPFKNSSYKKPVMLNVSSILVNLSYFQVFIYPFFGGRGSLYIADLWNFE